MKISTEPGSTVGSTRSHTFKFVRSAIAIMRPLQWVKNALVFAPALFGGVIANPTVLRNAATSFVALTLVASAVYSFNDAIDAPVDRLHPYKSQRPVAAGLIGRRSAFVLSAVLLLAGLATASLLETRLVEVWLLTYVVANIVYSTWAKHVVLLDIFVLDFGYLVRLLIGGAAAGVALSQWILLVAAFAAAVLVVGKRRQERVRFDTEPLATRRIVASYPVAWLDSLLMMCIGVTTVFYALWAFEAAELSGNSVLPWTAGPAAFGLIRYGYLVQTTDLGEAPEHVLIQDAPILAAMLAWVLSIGFSIYVL